jgi:hypothetical protein
MRVMTQTLPKHVCVWRATEPIIFGFSQKLSPNMYESNELLDPPSLGSAKHGA